jgi:hypothetical protein
MSNTKIHKLKAKYKCGLIDNKTAPEKLRNSWRRHSRETGYFRDLKNKLTETIQKRELQNERISIFKSI